MLKRLMFCLAMSAASFPVAAVDYTNYTDLWYTPSESGWGVNMVQSDTFIFATFFIYGQNGSPTWYSAQMTWDGTSQYTGGLYQTAGTWFASAWVPGSVSTVQVGNATFIPSTVDAYEGTLAYTVSGAGSVTKAIQRQTLTSITIGGIYTGGQSGTYASCSQNALNGGYIDRYDLTVTQQTAGAVTFFFNYVSGDSCTFGGNLHQAGQLYDISGATYVCASGLSTTANMTEIKATAQGIEGRFFAPNVGANCSEKAQFSAVLQ